MTMILIKLWVIVAASWNFTAGQRDEESLRLQVEHRGDGCDCMEYWACVSRGGQAYSYCGLMESTVCCLLSPDEDITAKPKCGIKGFDSGVIGVAEPSEWPWHVAIVEEPGFYYVCGGSLIDESWVLTAAHCVFPYINQTNVKLKVRLGEHDIASSSEALPHEDRSVKEVVIHPFFNISNLDDNIALLQLQTPARQRHHIDVVCLPKKDQVAGKTCFLTGWGKTTEDGDYSKVLKEVPIPLWSDQDCEFALTKEVGSDFRNLNNNTICAGATGRDACEGDGGGPLVCAEDGQWVQQGIVSFGYGCGQRGVPGIYTKVSKYIQWIRSTILKNI